MKLLLTILMLLNISCGAMDESYQFDSDFRARYQKHFKTDLRTVVVLSNASVYFNNTQGSTIRLAIGQFIDFNDPMFIKLMLHELIHCEQYLRKSNAGFAADYASDAIKNGLSHDDLDLELEAEERSEEIFLNYYHYIGE